MRVSCLAGRDETGSPFAVFGTFSSNPGRDSASLRLWLEDRKANGDAFPDERVVRLPRRYSREGARYETKLGKVRVA
jgi:hypothetical protein